MNWLDSAVRVVVSFFPPDLSPGYLRSLGVPVAQTIGMACAGMVVALALGIPLSVWIATRAPGHRLVAGALAALRAIPDLTLAILAVVLLGLGPAAGIAALAVFYTAMIGKVFGELLLAAPPASIDAIRATGAPRVSVAAYAMIPTMLHDLLSFGAYSFDCAIRASVIVGAVGAGGIGTELVGAINGLQYQRATTLILVLLVVIALVDALSSLVRRNPRMALLLIPIGLATLWIDRPQLFALGHAVVTIGKMFPPQLNTQEIGSLPGLLLQTAFIAIVGTALGAILAFAGALCAARNVAPLPLVFAVRRVLDVARAVPELVWGLILVVTVGAGPLAGMLALAVHSGGVLGKLYAESFENVPHAPLNAIVSTGASTLQTVAYATVPLALGPMAVHTLFRLEWNVRAAAVLGMIGAGGIGQALFFAQQLFFYKTMMAYVAITWAIVLLADGLGERFRRDPRQRQMP